MEIILGKNLKSMRAARGITQDELAESLGVSFQSVSKWERGECFPDIGLLPGIANYFSVSCDELLGMDKIRSREQMNHVFKKAHAYEAEGKYAEAAGLLREGIKVLPNCYAYQAELALALTHMAAAGDEHHTLKREAISLSEKVLANSTNEKLRATTRANLVFLLVETGETGRPPILRAHCLTSGKAAR